MPRPTPRPNAKKTCSRRSARLPRPSGRSSARRTLPKFEIPIEQATTPSLEALQAYTLGRAERAKGKEIESIPFFRRALELDHDFAAAHTMLSTVYGVLGELGQSEEHARDAYARRDRVSERERFLITYQYHDRVTGDQVESLRTLDLWKATYPRDFVPANARALIFNHLGLFERAVDEAKEALERQPDHPFPLSNLAYAYRGLNNLVEARRGAQRAIDLKVETSPTRRLMYQIELQEGHREAADAHLVWARDRPREFDLVSARAQWLAWQGKMHEARDVYQQVTDLAITAEPAGDRRRLSGPPGVDRSALRQQSRRLAVARQSLFGDAWPLVVARLGPAVPRGCRPGPGRRPRYGRRVAREMARRYPQSTLTTAIMGPVAGAAGAITRGRYADAVTRLKAASDYELGTVATLVPVVRPWPGVSGSRGRSQRARAVSTHPRSSRHAIRSRPSARWRSSASRARWRSRRSRRTRSPPIAPSLRHGAAPTPTCRSCATRAPRPRVCRDAPNTN